MNARSRRRRRNASRGFGGRNCITGRSVRCLPTASISGSGKSARAAGLAIRTRSRRSTATTGLSVLVSTVSSWFLALVSSAASARWLSKSRLLAIATAACGASSSIRRRSSSSNTRPSRRTITSSTPTTSSPNISGTPMSAPNVSCASGRSGSPSTC
ncbi:MAG: hypothetical protein M5R40_21515 [Anaerolineae bacterium]|nr:hypothetical protein [Anaerolineae bacterium]